MSSDIAQTKPFHVLELVCNIVLGNTKATDSIKSKVSSKTSHGKKDSTKRHH